jgi:hypothetical protein
MTGEKTVTIASLIQISMPPRSAAIASAAANTASASATSSGTTMALPPSRSTSPRTASSASRSRAISARWAPARANRRAVARPTPADAPVMTTVDCDKFFDVRAILLPFGQRMAAAIGSARLVRLSRTQQNQ